MELSKVLAEIAIQGVFEGMVSHSKVIIGFLENEPISETAKLSLLSLVLMSEDNYLGVVELLETWCEQETTLDTAHAYLALAYWQLARTEQAVQWCHRIITESSDTTTQTLAHEILAQVGT
ncbi:hypothetical protein [Marinibactrum halimedae]|uniref:Tetratricopeptide repeat protein n=1 Tax=Marinibactrum halimedae TaxID=1444977 RepID=A0AA37T425_9GAMM|nr:hypothetical protein [Marinibactrum halimedae]MCD9459091.1 hypothetical protein [Marinibactrum halimedae]GLS24692.1 hypothetical protein GCM10007877_04060 [Marinibactrum halimedae]